MEVVFVTFETELDPDELERTLRERAEKFRAVDGLVQKFYLRDDANGRVGGFYVFDSEASREAFFASDLRATIPDAYSVKGEPDVSTFHLLFPLREAEEFPTPA
jgi:heme-degrading monooxygenase HmoA